MKWRFSLVVLLGATAFAQEPDPHAGHQMPAAAPAHDHANMLAQGNMNDAGMYLMTMNSGTGVAPKSWPMPMLMPKLGSWNTMIMGQAFLVDTQQSGPRGADKLYSPNWIMASAIHKLGSGSVMLQTMFSLDPATITNQRYPLLFQTGETAHGRALVDAQHPHDFIMGLGVHYARPLSENTMLQLYYAPMGDPALGPVAFPHRASAFDLPQATISHHLQDSTHVLANVVTGALRYKWLRLEASGFHGTEPDENRWNIDFGGMNSYSGRLSIFPSANWMAQFSAGHLTNPERDHPGDVFRTTASLHYTRPTGGGNAWSTSLIWGRNHNQASKQNLNSYLLESLYPVTRKDFLTGRIELVDKNELFANDHELEEEIAQKFGSTFRIQAYTAGYTRDVPLIHNVETGIGANLTAYVAPSALNAFYGDHPWGVSMYLRVRLKKDQ
ncbi:MAG: hypothetical protein WDO18_20525 [Acidobacteriota bacterium]